MESSLRAGPGCLLVGGGGGSSAENGSSVGIPAGSMTDIPSLKAIRILVGRWLVLNGTVWVNIRT